MKCWFVAWIDICTIGMLISSKFNQFTWRFTKNPLTFHFFDSIWTNMTLCFEKWDWQLLHMSLYQYLVCDHRFWAYPVTTLPNFGKMLQIPILFPKFGKLVLNYQNHKPVISKRPLYYLPIYGNIFLSVGRQIPNASSFNSCKKMFPKFGNYIQGITNF